MLGALTTTSGGDGDEVGVFQEMLSVT